MRCLQAATHGSEQQRARTKDDHLSAVQGGGVVVARGRRLSVHLQPPPAAGHQVERPQVSACVRVQRCCCADKSARVGLHGDKLAPHRSCVSLNLCCDQNAAAQQARTAQPAAAAAWTHP